MLNRFTKAALDYLVIEVFVICLVAYTALRIHLTFDLDNLIQVLVMLTLLTVSVVIAIVLSTTAIDQLVAKDRLSLNTGGSIRFVGGLIYTITWIGPLFWGSGVINIAMITLNILWLALTAVTFIALAAARFLPPKAQKAHFA